MGDDNLEIDTSLYRDMYIVTEFLNCTHEEFLKKSKIEKIKLRLFLSVKMKKQQKELNELNEK